MAEAAASVNTTTPRYFCHKCSDEINPLPEFICPQCRLGFIEELTTPRLSQTTNVDSNDSTRNEFLNLFQSMQSAQGPGQGPSTSQQQRPVGGSFVQITEGQPNPLETILQQLLTNVVSASGRESGGGQGPFRAHLASIGVDIPIPFLHVLHGNPGDYAWGSGGLDAVVSQLLNNLDNSTGPPPMAKADIQNLPNVSVTRDQIEKNLQCSVCMDDFKLEEQVKQVPCGHCYHKDCIVPWLELHNSCPICRKIFDPISDGADHRSNSTATSTSNSSSNSHASSSNVPGFQYEDLNEYD